MTIEIHGPDGSSFSFPDGTPGDVITGAMSAHYGAAKAPAAPSMSAGDTAADVAKSGGIGLVKGAIGLAGLPHDLPAAIEGLADYGNRKAVEWGVPGAVPRNATKINNPLPGAHDIQSAVEGATGKFYEPKSTAGEYAQTFGEFAPAVLGGGGGLATRLATRVAAPALASETAGQLTKGTEAEPWARIAAALLSPAAIRGAGGVTRPLTDPIMSRLSPESFADTKLAQTYQRAGMTPEQVARALETAGQENQGMFTVADALGNAGQRSLSAVARIPHDERAALVEALEGRQAGQGRRVSSALAEGFDAPQTAAQTRTNLTNARDRASDVNYGAVRDDAGPVDLSRAIARIDQTTRPGVTGMMRPGSNIADDSVETALNGIRSRLTDGRSNLTDFEAVQRVRGDLADKIAVAQRAGEGNKVRLLSQVRAEIDAAMEDASQGYRAANAQHAARSRAIDAIDEGTVAATRGRVEDTIPAFRAMPPSQQAAFRTGYVDPLIGQTQGAAIGANKARPLLNDAFAQESAAMAPMRTQPRMQRRIGRENTMFETRNQALGGSRTADNLADSADLAISDPRVLVNLLHGNLMGAAGHAATRVLAEARGLSPPVAERMARALMETRPDQATAHAQAAIGRMQGGYRASDHRSLLASALLGVRGGTEANESLR